MAMNGQQVGHVMWEDRGSGQPDVVGGVWCRTAVHHTSSCAATCCVEGLLMAIEGQ
jgi:hypothetical protein